MKELTASQDTGPGFIVSKGMRFTNENGQLSMILSDFLRGSLGQDLPCALVVVPGHEHMSLSDVFPRK